MKKMSVRNLVVTAMLAAISALLMAMSFSVPFMPVFIKMDISELPALIGSFALGPVYGVLICLVKNLINLFFTTTGGVGEFANFLLGAVFVFPAGLIYKRHKTRGGAVWGSVFAAAVCAVSSLFVNYYITYPFYTKILPIEQIIEMYSAIFPGVNGLWSCLLIFNMPFTFFKNIINTIITFVIYKRISHLIKGK